MFLLFDREEKYISTLKDVLEAKHTEEINGEDVLEITTLDPKVAKGYKIAYKNKLGHWKEFTVKEIEEPHTSDGIEKRLFCESSFYEAFGDYIEDKRPQNVPSSAALAEALAPTRWAVGIVDDLGLNSTNFYRCSAKKAVQRVAEVWKGEIRTRVEVVGNKIAHRYIDLLARRGGDYGKRFTYSKSLESVTRTIHRDDVITALYGYGKGEEVGDGHGRRIDFASINEGKAYVENLDALAIWGRPNSDGTKSHVFGKAEFDEVELKEELLQLTLGKLEEISKPLITYEVNVIDLDKKHKTINENTTEEIRVVVPFSKEKFIDTSYTARTVETISTELGDNVAIIDTEFTPELRLKARAIKIVRDLLHPEDNDIILGNFIPSIADSLNAQQEHINNFRGKQGVWDRSNAFNDDGTLSAQFLSNLVDELNQKMNSQGGYVFVSEDGRGFYTTDKPTIEESTMAIQLVGGGFRIANCKLPNGEFDWRTFGDGNGFLADAFIGGLLKGGKVHFDLTNGTLLIGDNVEDYQLYFDGTRLRINGEVSSSSVIVGDETLEQTLINLGSEIERIQGGGGNLLLNSNYGTYDNPSDYWWSANGLTWLLYEARIDSWTQHEALIQSWSSFENYDW